MLYSLEDRLNCTHSKFLLDPGYHECNPLATR